MTPVASSDRLIVGVDFGTTFSGIAYSYSASPDGPNNIPVIQSWPGHNNCTSYKVPSELAYATAETISQQSSAASRSRGAAGASRPSRLSPSNDIFNFTNLNASLPRASTSVPSVGQVRWGFELQPDETRLRCLKLFLDPSQRIPSFVSQTDMHDQLRRSGKDVPTAISDYLTELFKHARKTLAERYGEFFINTTRLEFVLTVPAIWSDAAKEATKAAAKRAGIREEIRMISEPEAAAVYTLQAIQPNHLKEGDNFIVCDAGGGTVDLISYEIKQISPLRVEESVGGTGACCGATFLNIKFEEYVRSKLGENAFRALRERRPRAWLAAMNYFEDYVKRKFYPEDRTDFNIPFPGVEDNRAAGIEQGFLTMSSEAVGNLFRPIVAAIIKLVEQQMASLQSQAKRVSGIILVGGFGQSRCLYRCLQTRFAYVEPPPPYSNGSFDRRESDRRFEVMQPNHAWTAVVRGAVLRGLEGNELVLSRKARRHYGVLMRTEWKSGTHSKNECVWDKDEEKWMVDNRVEWYITKGQTCASKDSILFPFYNTFRQRTGMSQISTLVICDDDVPPEKYDPSDTGPIRRLCKLPVNLESVPDRFWKSKRNSKGQSFERLEYVLGMRVGSGGLRFDHRVDDVSYGEVTADFN